ncbi:hypothetical protein [Bradyrhizobium sp. Gha]|uniref:hypothetical protein n=1 Tax=Bradyrhizobium sp. Gha TaxID=1855318 RepID=UPI0008DF8C3F|nr:hypothetical protein [Bradyrhizobium sp. Gha]SFI09607.1 hypothetical protein SAMN05216525_10484 [Bradyrhizobium sp. Gha]
MEAKIGKAIWFPFGAGRLARLWSHLARNTRFSTAAIAAASIYLGIEDRILGMRRRLLPYN